MLLLIACNFWTLLTVVNVANCAAARGVLLIHNPARPRGGLLIFSKMSCTMVWLVAKHAHCRYLEHPLQGRVCPFDDMHAYAECSTELVSIVTMSYTTAVHLQEELSLMPQCHCGSVGCKHANVLNTTFIACGLLMLMFG